MKAQAKRKNHWILIPLLVAIFLFSVNLIAQKKNSELDSAESYKLSLVRDSPVYPGCEGTEFEIRKCLSESIKRDFEHHFNVDLIGDLDSNMESKRIFLAYFHISSEGQIKSIRTYSEDAAIKNEVSRVASLLPTMIPGKRKGQSVNVTYSVGMRLNNGELQVISKPTNY